MKNEIEYWLKVMGFHFFLNAWVKVLIKLSVKIRLANTVKNFLIMSENRIQMHLQLV